uniref:Transposase-associated domain-containing protein n=1 Tax=Oryza brachyantha TaxID=4533 RepID=J3MEH0_ORYBR
MAALEPGLLFNASAGQVVIPSVNKNDEDTIDQTAQDYIKPEEKKEDSTKPIQIDLDSLEDVADPDALVDEIYYRGIYVSDPEDEDLETEGNVLSSILRDRDRASSREARSKGYLIGRIMSDCTAMDNSWMEISNRTLPEYEKGVEQFIQFAFKDNSADKFLRCPCRKCKNNHFFAQNTIKEHLFINGVQKDYKLWVYHGEDVPNSEDSGSSDMEENQGDHGMHQMMNDLGETMAMNMGSLGSSAPGLDEGKDSSTVTNEETNKFYRLLEDAEKDLYPGCSTFSTLAFIVQMLNIKCLYDISANAMEALFSMLCKALPASNKVPKSYSDAKKTITDLGLDYTKIDACLNDCILYRGVYEKANSCIFQDGKMIMSLNQEGEE